MSCKPGTKLCLIRGADARIRYTVVDDDGAVDLTDWLLYFTVKSLLTDEDADQVFQKRNDNAGGSDDEIELLDQNDSPGQFDVVIARADTVDLGNPAYYYDAWAVSPDGTHHPLHGPGQLTIGRPVMLAPSDP